MINCQIDVVMKSIYKTKGTCSTQIEVEVCDGLVKSVCFRGGCSGNLQGICRLVEGMPVEEVKHRLSGIRCGNKQTSCPDQLCQALDAMVSE